METRHLTKEEFENLPTDLYWEKVGTYDDRECSINHLEAETEKGKYFAGCYANDEDGETPDFELDVLFEPAKICCGNFEYIMKNFSWFFMEGENSKKVLLMPYFGQNKRRVNHCPCCGASVRNVEIEESNFNLYK